MDAVRMSGMDIKRKVLRAPVTRPVMHLFTTNLRLPALPSPM